MADSLVRVAVELVKCIARPISKCWTYHRGMEKNMERLNKGLEELTRRKRDMESKVDDEHVQGETKLREEVEWWLKEVEKIEREVNNIEEKVRKVKYFSRASLTKDIIQKIDEVKEHFAKGTFAEGLVISCPAPILIRAPSVLEEGTFKEKLEEIWACLINNEVTRIGVYGMGGSGKTTVLKDVHDRAVKSKDKFGDVIWVTVSKDSDTLNLQYKLAHMLDLNVSNDGDELRASKLRTRLKAKKRLVLILDDLWEPLYSLHDVGIPEPTPENGCKLVLTTRSLDVCRGMFCKPIQMELLSPNEASELFLRKVGHEVSSIQSLKKFVDQIVEQCARLPLAIVTIAGGLRGRVDKDEWVIALEELQQATKGSASDNIIKTLKFSYDRLRKELQGCLLYCALFPEDHEIERNLLIEYLTVEWTIPKMPTRELEMGKGRVMINELVNVSLLNEMNDYSGVKRVKMHDLIRDMALQIVSESPRYLVKAGMGLKSIPTEERDWKADIVKASLMSNNLSDILPGSVSPNCPTLSTLLMSGNFSLRSISDDFFLHFKALNVLDLSYTALKNLPESISDLVTLEALFLRHCRRLRRVPSLAKIKDLKKLDLSSSGIDEVPHGLEILVKLTYLDFSCCPLKNIPDGILCRLPNLQFLSLTYIIWGPKIKGEELADLTKIEDFEVVVDSAESFNAYVRSLGEEGPRPIRYKLQLGFSDSQLVYASQNSGDKVVYLTSNWQDSSAVTIDRCSLLLPKDVTMLAIEHCLENMDSVCELTSHHDAAELRDCYVKDSCGMRHLFSHSDSSVPLLPSLEILDLDGVDLCELIKRSRSSGEPSNLPPPGSFSSLKELRICDCNNMKKLFQYEITSLPNLQELTLNRCKKLEAIVSTRSDDEARLAEEEITEQIINTIALPKLKSIFLWDLPKLQYIPVIADSLQEIRIEKCPKLERIHFVDEVKDLCELIKSRSSGVLPHLPPAGSFSALKELRICDCNNMKKLFQFEITSLPNLEQLTLKRCEKLEAIMSTRSDDEERQAGEEITEQAINTIALPKLKSIYLWDLPKLQYIPVIADSLQEIDIYKCPKLERIHFLDEVKDLCELIKRSRSSRGPSNLPPAGSFSSLEELRICDCNNMKKLFQFEITSLPNLEELTLSSCEKLEAITSTRSDDEDHQAEEEITEQAINTIDLPKIKKIDLSHLPKLQHIAIIADSLQEIFIHECPKLEKIPFLDRESCPPLLHSHHDAAKLVCYVKDCSGMRYLFCHSDSSVPLLPSLESLNLDGVKDLCELIKRSTSSGEPSNLPPAGSFSSLKELTIIDCNSMKKLFQFEITSFPNLELLNLERCENLEAIMSTRSDDQEYQAEEEITEQAINAIALPKLKTIYLWDLPKLQHIPVIADSLQEIFIYECPKLEMIPFLDRETCPPLLGGYIDQSTWKSLKWDYPNAKNDVESRVSFTTDTIDADRYFRIFQHQIRWLARAVHLTQEW